MPFDSSLPDEVAPGEATALRCKYWNVPIGMRCKLVYDHPGIHKFDLTNGNEPTEPKGSGSSSPDDLCGRCPHVRKDHKVVCCVQCTLDDMGTEAQHECHTFVPAAGETAGEPGAHEHDWTEWGAVYHGGHFQWRDCRGCGNTESTPEGHFCPACAPVCKAPSGCHAPSACKDSCAFEDQLKGIRLVPRPEAPDLCEIPHETTEDEDACEAAHLAAEPEAPELRLADLGKLGAEPECNDAEGCHRVIPCDPGCAASSRALRAAMAAPPPRPPYAVAYVTGSGARIELALPGEASCAVIDGALVICHPSQVLGIAEVKPWEGP